MTDQQTALSMATDPALTKERFSFTIFLSACLHVMVIVGVGFSPLDEFRSAPAVEVTLAQYRSQEAPEQADFVAQENQAGSGSEEAALAPSSPFQADFSADVIQEVSPPTSPRQTAVEPDIAILTAAQAPRVQAQQEAEKEEDAAEALDETSSPAGLSLAIASLQAQLDRQQRAYAERPRRYTISSASARRSDDALYLDSWRRQIEAVGNLNYPDEARAQNLFGSLRLMVALRLDGTVAELQVLQSSGHRVLDEAAISIVRLAAPFEPFPAAMREEADILEIIRTWKFHQGNSFSTSQGNLYPR